MKLRLILCGLGWHVWVYLPNLASNGQKHGGRPMIRSCATCGIKQCWDYDKARAGQIVWIDIGQ